jgi:hypothetical protein
VTVERGSWAWYPVRTASRVEFVQALRARDDLRWLGLAGLRYTFVNGTDARLEYVHQDAGWSRAQFNLAPAALSGGAARLAFEAYAAPGLEFVGRRLALVSVRLPDLGPADRAQVQARYLRSFTDRSGVAFVTASLDATEAMVLFASAAATHGEATSEFGRFVRASLVAGAVYAW